MRADCWSSRNLPAYRHPVSPASSALGKRAAVSNAASSVGRDMAFAPHRDGGDGGRRCANDVNGDERRRVRNTPEAHP